MTGKSLGLDSLVQGHQVTNLSSLVSTLRSIWVILTLAAFAGQETIHAKDLATYQKQFQATLDKVGEDNPTLLKRLKDGYAERLAAIKQEVQSDGDLDKLKAVQQELSRFEKDQSFPKEDAELIDEIALLANRCHEYIANLQLENAKSVVALAERYDQTLEGLQRELTRGGKIEEASAVQEERKSIETRTTVSNARTYIESVPVDETLIVIAKPKAEPEMGSQQVVGNWIKINTNTEFKVQADGTVTARSAQSSKYRKGKWTFDDPVLTLIYDSETLRLRLEQDDFLTGMDPNSRTWQFSKID